MSTTPDGLEIINTDQFGLVVSASEHNKTVAALKAEVERLKALLAASCVDERNLAISENPLVHGCDEAIKLEAEVERLRTLVCYGTDKERLEYKQSICKHSWQESGHGFKYCILCDQTIITKFFKSI